MAEAINRARVAVIKNTARELVARTWGEWAWNDFDWIISRESGWNYKAVNKYSSAFGLCQALPASKMGADRKSWLVQVNWCVDYIKQRYGNVVTAKRFWRANNWF